MSWRPSRHAPLPAKLSRKDVAALGRDRCQIDREQLPRGLHNVVAGHGSDSSRTYASEKTDAAAVARTPSRLQSAQKRRRAPRRRAKDAAVATPRASRLPQVLSLTAALVGRRAHVTRSSSNVSRSLFWDVSRSTQKLPNPPHRARASPPPPSPVPPRQSPAGRGVAQITSGNERARPYAR